MDQPRMVIIAGPPGAGKSSIFALSDFAENIFNADDRAAELNGGSSQSIPLGIRAIVNREFEQFVHANIAAGKSFALETTLRSAITFEQARLAKENGFRVFLRYVALETVEQHASEATLRGIHASSLANLPIALDPEKSGIEIVRIYDNSRTEARPLLALAARRGKIVLLRDKFPDWLLRTLGWTPQQLDIRRRELMR